MAGITPGEQPRVSLEGGDTLRAGKVVLSAGAWSAKFAKAMGAGVKLEAERRTNTDMSPNRPDRF